MNKALTDKLRELLAEAVAGNITGITFATVNDKHTCLSSWAGNVDSHVYEMRGALAVLARDFEDEFVEGMRPARQHQKRVA